MLTGDQVALFFLQSRNCGEKSGELGHKLLSFFFTTCRLSNAKVI